MDVSAVQNYNVFTKSPFSSITDNKEFFRSSGLSPFDGTFFAFLCDAKRHLKSDEMLQWEKTANKQVGRKWYQ